MNQEVASTSFLQVSYRSEACLLVGRWLNSITEEQLHEGYEIMRRISLQHQCTFWLIDARRRVDRSHNGPEWVVTTFLPQVQRDLGQPLSVAFLVLPNHLAEVASDPARVEKSSHAYDPFQFARFIDEGAANAWLDARRHNE